MANEHDFALQHSVWGLNQITKPTGTLYGLGDNTLSRYSNNYSGYLRDKLIYRGVLYSADESEYYDRFLVSDSLGPATVISWNDTPPRDSWLIASGDKFEHQNFIMAFMSQSRVIPLGANLEPVTGMETVNLVDLLPVGDPHKTIDRPAWKCHAYHSARYRSTMARRHKYWAYVSREHLDVSPNKTLVGE